MALKAPGSGKNRIQLEILSAPGHKCFISSTAKKEAKPPHTIHVHCIVINYLSECT